MAVSQLSQELGANLTRWIARLSVALVLVVVACGSSSTSSSGGPSFKLITQGQLNVAVWGTSIPSVIVGSGDELTGIAGAYITAFARDNHLTLKLYKTTFASTILATQQNKVDMATYLYYTPQRAQAVYFSNSFNEDHSAVYTIKSKGYTLADLNGKRVGTVTGFVYVPYLQKLYGSKAILFPDDVSAATALLNGQIDAYVNGTGIEKAPPLNQSNDIAVTILQPGDMGMPDSVINNLEYNIVNCNNKALATALNDYLDKMRSSGAWTKVLTANGYGSNLDSPPQAPPKQECS